MVQRMHQQLPTLRVVEEIVLDVGVAVDDPDVPQHFVSMRAERPVRRSLAQLVSSSQARAQQADDDLAIGNEV